MEGVADDFLEDEIQVEQEPFQADGTAALMMLLIAPPTWNPMQAPPSTNAPATPPPSGSRRPEAPVITDPSVPNSVDIPAIDEADAPVAQQASTPLLTDSQEAENEPAFPEDIEMEAKPAVNTAIPAVRTDKPAEESYPRQLPLKTQSQEMPDENATRQNAATPTEHEARPPIESSDLVAADNPDAMFLPSPRLVVRNPVPRPTRTEHTAFEVELSDKVDKGPQVEEPSDISRPKLVKEENTIDDPSGAESSASSVQGVTPAPPECVGDAKPPQLEAPRTNGLTPPSNTPSQARQSTTAPERESPPLRQTSVAAALEHTLDKPKPFHTSNGLQLRVGPREDVSIHVNQIAGNVRISVRSVDPDLTRELQAGVPDLLAVLNETGINAEATIPDIGSPIAEGKESTISNFANAGSGLSQDRNTDANSDSSGQHRRHRRPDQQWKEWLEER